MPVEISFGTIQYKQPEAPRPESPFRIGVIADFSGRQNRGMAGSSEEIATRRLVRVSRDNLDDVMAKMAVQLKLPVGGDASTVTLSFASLDDFHPDQIHDRVEKIADEYESAEKSTLMNSVLHHPDFKALESAWRGVHWLLGRVMKGSQVEVLLLDISLAEVADDFRPTENLAWSGLHQLLIEKGIRGAKGQAWGAFVGDFVFDFSAAHAGLLGRLAKIAAQANAPFLSTVHPRVLDQTFALNPDESSAWQALRELPEADLLGLAVPRFLLRLPYGENTQAISRFSFEEMSIPPDRDGYLWGSPALACAALLAQAFHKSGWACTPGSILDLDNLPIHVYTLDGDEEVTLAEAWLMRPQTERLTKQGIMAFLCVRGKGAIQLVRFQSLAQPTDGQPACELGGHWSTPIEAPMPPAPSRPTSTVGMVGQVPDPPKPTAAKAAPPAKPAGKPKPAPPASTPAVKAAAPTKAPPPSAPAKPTPTPPEPEPAPAEEEMDPELAALLKQLE